MGRVAGVIEVELVEATALKEKPKERRDSFLKRLNKAVNDKADADELFWDSLSVGAQQWVNKNNEILAAGKDDLKDFPGSVNVESALSSAPKPGKTGIRTDKKVAVPEVQTAPDPKPPVKPKEAGKPKVDKKRPIGKFETIMRLALLHPKRTGPELAGMLPDISAASVISVHGDLRRTFRMLHDMGLVADNPF